MKWTAILTCLLLAGCATPHEIRDRDDYLAEASRTYTAKTKEQVIRAAEIVLKNSDPSDWDMRYEGDGFVGLRRYFIYAVLATQSGREKWQFQARESGDSIQASLTVSEAGVGAGGYNVTPYERSMSSIELYRLFWARVDYVLGIRSDWMTCAQAKGKAGSDALSGLCGSTSGGRNAPPPQRLI